MAGAAAELAVGGEAAGGSGLMSGGLGSLVGRLPIIGPLMGGAMGGHGQGGDQQQQPQTPMPDLSTLSALDQNIIPPWTHMEVEQVVEPGPHTVEVDVGEDNPVIIQHDKPGVAEQAKEKVEAKTAEFDHPSTNDRNYTEDPHQFDAESTIAPNPYDPTVNGEGGTDEGMLTPELQERVQSALPLILQYYNSPESGANDPIIRSLHDQLETNHPGYLQVSPTPDDEKRIEALRQNVKANLPGPQVGPHPADNRTCSHCGATLTVGEMTCPQCGASAWSATPQGPNPPQFNQPMPGAGQQMSTNPYAASSEFEPHCERCGAEKARKGTPEHPLCSNCANDDQDWTLDHNNDDKEASVRTAQDPMMMGGGGQDPSMMGGPPGGVDPTALGPPPAPAPQPTYQGPHTSEQFAAVAQLLQEEGRGDEVPTMLQQPWEYADEMARAQHQVNKPPLDAMQDLQPQPAQEEAPPEETMPVPGMSGQQMASAVARYAADTIARPCPECGSHTTGLITPEGDSRCHSCGEKFKTQVLEDKVDKSSRVSLRDNPEAVPAADQHAQRDISQEQDPSHQWVDESGDPLISGQQYRMFTVGYDIPDIVRITHVKPDAVNYEIQGAYNVGHAAELTREDAQMEQVTFQGPLGAGDEDETQDPSTQSDNIGPEGMPEQSDLSTTPMRASKQAVLNANPPVDEYGESYPSGAIKCPTCAGQDANCITCGGRGFLEARQLADEGFLTPQDSSQVAERPEGIYTQGLEPNYGKTAGAKMTPMEQREYIDEQGMARNADKLELEGTHYVEADDDQFLFGF